MSSPATLVSVIAMVIGASALGLAVHNKTSMSDHATVESLASAGVQLKNEIKQDLSETPEAFEKRVELALEAIVERRRAEMIEAQKKAGVSQDGTSALDAKGMLSLNTNNQVVYGNPDAPVTIYSFEDFRCGFCERYHPIVQQYVAESNGQINMVYKPYPILGAASEQLALAGECVAQLEGPEAFWRYAEQAYATKNWNTAIKYSELKNVDAITNCVREGTYQGNIDKSVAEGRQLNITGTPASVFRNNQTEKGALVPGYLEPKQIGEMVQRILGEEGAK